LGAQRARAFCSLSFSSRPPSFFPRNRSPAPPKHRQEGLHCRRRRRSGASLGRARFKRDARGRTTHPTQRLQRPLSPHSPPSSPPPIAPHKPTTQTKQGFGWAIAKALAEAGAEISLGVWVRLLSLRARHWLSPAATRAPSSSPSRRAARGRAAPARSPPLVTCKPKTHLPKPH
jgi:hypothetical protein